MKVLLILVLVAIALASVGEAASNGRRGQVRYLNSMAPFGKAKVFASDPSTLLFDQVAGGTLTDYSSIDAQPWTFTSKFTSNVNAQSDPEDLESDSYATVFTCQVGNRKIKNKLIYDTSRTPGPNVALLRTVNIAQYDYPISVRNNDTTDLFLHVPYCSASSYIQLAPGSYGLEWNVDNFKRQTCIPGNCSHHFPLKAGTTYTFFVTSSSSVLVVDGKTKKARSVGEEVTSVVAVKERVVAEVAPKNKKLLSRRSKQQRALLIPL